ncbi:PhnE/PtxC family ABC transporter permease [Noviherbaspirillum soli]|uniref:PhnE/PtxC family ABC transporter permease n=1 Tax=Noviherbaspirillum soli TaxID=1064518 RepID=UPI00188D1C59|nr:ABC transporter permease subunit [Noviherbaspirillum soli]
MTLASRRPARLWLFALLYGLLIAASVASFVRAGDFQFGRKPWQNLTRTLHELSRPSLVDAWLGERAFVYRDDAGRVVRTEDRRALERAYLLGLLEATWTTIKVATLGSLAAALAALPFGVLAARNMLAPRWLAAPARLLLDAARAIHALVFGLLLVGIIGLGPMAGILAIAFHSFGSYGKLYADAIESIDRRLIDAGLVLGMTPLQTLVHALPRTMLPQALAIHLYIWEFNVRDSTVLGLIGVGGLGLLVSEAVSLFQWGRLATLLLAIVLLVTVFDRVSRRVRAELALRH